MTGATKLRVCVASKLAVSKQNLSNAQKRNNELPRRSDGKHQLEKENRRIEVARENIEVGKYKNTKLKFILDKLEREAQAIGAEWDISDFKIAASENEKRTAKERGRNIISNKIS